MITVMKDTDDRNYPSAVQSAWNCKCPRCRRGNMFEGSIFSFSRSARQMRTVCPHCELMFEKEPGYFYVAMYVSYVFVVAQLIASCVATYVITGNAESPWLYLTVACAAVIILAPFNYRYSRIVLLYWMTPSFRFRPELYDREPAKAI